MPLKHLFSEGKIGSLTLKNRIIMPAMGTFYPNKGGYVTDRLIAYHAARAQGGCGMNIVEITAVHPTTKSPRTSAIYDDMFIPGLTRLADAIKKAGGTAAVQLWHCRQANLQRFYGGPSRRSFANSLSPVQRHAC